MPSLSSSVLLLLSVTVMALALLPSPAFSTSRRCLQRPQVETRFRVNLEHVDSGKNLTKFERIQRGIKRGNHKLQSLWGMALKSVDVVQTPIHAGNGEFLMKLAIGTPPNSYSAVVDTGSDLIWTQCKPCIECYNQPTPIFNPKSSSSFSKVSCSNDLCEALPQPTCNDGCEYVYTYGDYSSTQGVLAEETFTFGDVSVSGIGFGCGQDNEGEGFSQGGGLVGLGRGPLSLVSQLKQEQFSYCLTSIDDTSKTSTFFMGSAESLNITTGEALIKTTPLIKNPSQPSFYYLALEGITVGGTRLPMKSSTFALQEDGTGGVIIDSGTTITYLEESGFDMLKKELISSMELPVDDSASTGLDLCFRLPAESKEVKVPKLVFHFKDADLELAGENYMIGDASMGVVCLAMGASSGMSIFGNVQQQNMLVTYDIGKETVSFLPTQCDKL